MKSKAIRGRRAAESANGKQARMAGSGDEAPEIGDMGTLNDRQSDPYVYDPDNHAPCVLAPRGAFSDEPAPRKCLDLLWPDHDPGRTGPNSASIESRLFSSCAGWPEPRTACELYDAIREPEPTRRQKNIVNMWAAEATPREIDLQSVGRARLHVAAARSRPASVGVPLSRQDTPAQPRG